MKARFAALKERTAATVERLRARHEWFDHAIRAVRHFGAVKSTILAGAVTYFGILSFFPIIAMVFATLGFIVQYTSPDVQDAVIKALQEALPGIFANLDTGAIQRAATAASIFGVLGFLYAGLGWISAMRSALESVFQVPRRATRSMIVGKLVDLVVLALLGVILVVSVAASSTVTAATSTILDATGLSDVAGSGLLLRAIGIILGVLASTLLFFVIMRVLPKANVATRARWQGALISAVGFEVLKLLATFVISSTANNPIYGAFAVIIALLVWINYFARLVLLGASWAATARPMTALAALETTAPPAAALAPSRIDPDPARTVLVAGAVAGAATVGAVMLARRVRDERSLTRWR